MVAGDSAYIQGEAEGRRIEKKNLEKRNDKG